MNLQQDIQDFLAQTGWKANRLAKEAGIDPGNLSRVIRGHRNLNSSSVEKLWPFIYGPRRPAQPDAARDAPSAAMMTTEGESS